jgi:hypothetical protein
MRNQGLQTMNNYGHDPNSEESGIPAGSSVSGVALSTTISTDGTSEMKGNHTEVKLDRGSRLQVALL